MEFPPDSDEKALRGNTWERVMINPCFIKIILVMVRTDWGGMGGRKTAGVFHLPLVPYFAIMFKLKYGLVLL